MNNLRRREVPRTMRVSSAPADGDLLRRSWGHPRSRGSTRAFVGVICAGHGVSGDRARVGDPHPATVPKVIVLPCTVPWAGALPEDTAPEISGNGRVQHPRAPRGAVPLGQSVTSQAWRLAGQDSP